jgi:FkbM family methyltransferase
MNQSELLERHHLRPSGVLHVGASEGQEVETYLEAGISKQILVEALPSVFARLAARVEGISGVSAVNACISDVPAEGVAFNVADNDGQSSSLLDFGIHRDLHPDVHFVDRMEVNTVRIDQLSLDLTGIDYLVTDLQGCDLRAIRSTGRLLAQFDAVYSEVNLGRSIKGTTRSRRWTATCRRTGLSGLRRPGSHRTGVTRFTCVSAEVRSPFSDESQLSLEQAFELVAAGAASWCESADCGSLVGVPPCLVQRSPAICSRRFDESWSQVVPTADKVERQADVPVGGVTQGRGEP